MSKDDQDQTRGPEEDNSDDASAEPTIIPSAPEDDAAEAPTVRYQPGIDAGGAAPAPTSEGPTSHARIGWVAALALIALVGIYLYQRSPQAPATAEMAPPQPRLDAQDADAAPTNTTLTQEATQYIDELTSGEADSVPAAEVDGFVAPDQKLRLREGEAGYVEQPVSELEPSTAVAVVRKEPQVEYRTPRQLIAEHGDNPDTVIELLDDTGLVRITLGELLQRHVDNLDWPLAVIVQSEYVEQTTAGQLQAAGEETARLLQEHFLPKEASIRDLFGGKISIQEGTVFYVRAIDADDVQGIWGIIHQGLVDGFARGIALQRGEDVAHYQVSIPRHADERNPDSTSSYLGRVIDAKVRESHTFSLRDGRMGQDPDLIRPGEEILLVHFTEDELVAIYKHFVSHAANGS